MGTASAASACAGSQPWSLPTRGAEALVASFRAAARVRAVVADVAGLARAEPGLEAVMVPKEADPVVDVAHEPLQTALLLAGAHLQNAIEDVT